MIYYSGLFLSQDFGLYWIHSCNHSINIYWMPTVFQMLFRDLMDISELEQRSLTSWNLYSSRQQ